MPITEIRPKRADAVKNSQVKIFASCFEKKGALRITAQRQASKAKVCSFEVGAVSDGDLRIATKGRFKRRTDAESMSSPATCPVKEFPTY